MGTRSFSAKALTEDVKNGISDAELLDRYDLGASELKKLLEGLVKAGYVTQAEIDARIQDWIEIPDLEPGERKAPGIGTGAHAPGPTSPRPPEPPVTRRGSQPQTASYEPQSNGHGPHYPQPRSPSIPASRDEASRAPSIPETQQCPYCQEDIRVGAKKCKHCGEFLDPRERAERARRDRAQSNPALPMTREAAARRRTSGWSLAIFFLVVVTLIKVVGMVLVMDAKTIQDLENLKGTAQALDGLVFLLAIPYFIGCYWIVAGKGRSGWYAALGLLSCIGLAIISSLRNEYES